MKIFCKSKVLQRACTEYKFACQKHGQKMAEKLHLRIDQLTAAVSFEELVQFRIGRCRELKGLLKGNYALDLIHPFRLIVAP